MLPLQLHVDGCVSTSRHACAVPRPHESFYHVVVQPHLASCYRAKRAASHDAIEEAICKRVYLRIGPMVARTTFIRARQVFPFEKHHRRAIWACDLSSVMAPRRLCASVCRVCCYKPSACSLIGTRYQRRWMPLRAPLTLVRPLTSRHSSS